MREIRTIRRRNYTDAEARERAQYAPLCSLADSILRRVQARGLDITKRTQPDTLAWKLIVAIADSRTDDEAMQSLLRLYVQLDTVDPYVVVFPVLDAEEYLVGLQRAIPQRFPHFFSDT